MDDAAGPHIYPGVGRVVDRIRALPYPPTPQIVVREPQFHTPLPFFYRTPIAVGVQPIADYQDKKGGRGVGGIYVSIPPYPQNVGC